MLSCLCYNSSVQEVRFCENTNINHKNIFFQYISKMNWEDLENSIGEEVPRCIKHILEVCGYSTIFSLIEIKEQQLNEIENFIKTHKQNIASIECNHSEYYRSIEEFKLLPGHSTMILALSKYALEYQEKTKSCQSSRQNDSFPFVLNELIKTAEQNLFRDPNHAQYPDTVRFFATYIFLLCGRSCYEMLRANLPLPSTKTICKLILLYSK